MRKEYRILSCDEEPLYRYRLDVSILIQSSNRLAIIQLNPSTANGTKADPTIGKVSCWAKEHEFGRVTFLNLFAFRSTDSNELVDKDYETLVGPRNNEVTRSALSAAGEIVFAWGEVDRVIDAHYKNRLRFLSQVLGDRPIHAVGKLVAGIFPRHGLMWNSENRMLRPYEWDHSLYRMDNRQKDI